MKNPRSYGKFSTRFTSTHLMMLKSMFSSLTMASLTIGFVCPSAQSQDAYGSGDPNDDSFATGYQNHAYDYDLSNSKTGLQNNCSDLEVSDADQFTGPSRNIGEDALMGRKEFNELVTLPDGRDVLGLSYCDLTCNRIVIEELKTPKDFPPLPESIKLPESITSESIRRPIPDLFCQWPRTRAGWNLGRIEAKSDELAGYSGRAPLERELAVLIPSKLLTKNARVSALACENPDYECRLAVMGLQYQHEYRVKTFSELNTDSLDLHKSMDETMLERVLRFKEILATKVPTTGNITVRESRAAQLEDTGNIYEALFERLKIEEMSGTGPSHYQVAKLYRTIGEDKLAFEKLKEAVESDWPLNKQNLLGEANRTLANVLMKAYGTATKVGNRELALGRLKNASSAYRQAFLINTQDSIALDGLNRTARIATVEEPCFHNYLLLGGTQLLSGKLEQAKEAYDKCATYKPNDSTLKQALKVFHRYECQRPNTSISKNVQIVK